MDELAETITTHFREEYGQWGLTLPAGALSRREAGHLFGGGWHIGWRFGEQDGEECLEILAQHRMTNDRHYLVLAGGATKGLETADEFMVFSPDATPEDRERIERDHAEQNRRVYAELHERGLLPPAGENLLAHEINEYLRSRPPSDDPPDPSSTA